MYLRAPRDTGFLFFPLCLLFWLKNVQLAYSLRSSPSWWPSSFGDQSPQQLQAQKLNKFQNYTIILRLSIIQIRTRCLKTVVTSLLFFIISGKMCLLGGSGDQQHYTDPSECLWRLSNIMGSLILTVTVDLRTTFFILRISSHAAAFMQVFESLQNETASHLQ